MDSLRLITFNIAHGRGLSFYQGFRSSNAIHSNLRKIANVLSTAKADLVAMQEVDERSFWNRNINLLDVIREEGAFDHSCIGINNSRSGRQNLSYGNAILSSLPINSHHNQPFSAASIGGKGFQYVEFDFKSSHIPLINIHLDYRSKFRRVEQIEQVIDFIESKQQLVGNDMVLPIICGDFNCSSARSGDAVEKLFCYLEEEKHYQLVPDNTRTFPAVLPARSIDFVFMPKRYQISKVEVLPVYVSDHRPVLVEFKPLTPAKHFSGV